MPWPNPSFSRWIGGPDRAIVEDGLTLDIHRMARGAVGGRGSSIAGRWRWSIGDEVRATLDYRISLIEDRRARLTLNYRLNGEPIEEAIWLEKRPCRFGGGRWYAKCPHTGRGAAKLYLPAGGRRFLSRRAYRMGYRSQCEPPIGRLLLKRDRLARRMGIDLECPTKPKWMRWETYDRTMRRLDVYDDVWGVEMMRKFGTRF